MCTTMSGDTTTTYPLYSACRYSNRLSAVLPCLSILQLTFCSTDYPLCSLWRYSSRPYMLCSSRSGDTTTEYPLNFACRYYNRLSAVFCLLILQSTIRSILPVDFTTDYALCSLLLYSDRPSAVTFLVYRYYNRLSYVFYSTLSAITTTDYPLYSKTATASFRSEIDRLIRSALSGDTTTDYPLYFSARY
jgi:hypothetical protein